MLPPALEVGARPDTSCRFLGASEYRVLLTARGSGGASCGRDALTPWRGDRVADSDGFHVYLRDLDSGAFWSVGAFAAGQDGARRSAVEAMLFQRCSR